MKVLMLSFDPTVRDPSSEAGRRMQAYRALVDDLYIAVFDSAEGVAGLWKLYQEGRAYIMKDRAHATSLVVTTQDPFEVGLVGYCLKLRYGCRLQLQVHTDFRNAYFRKESFKHTVRAWIARMILPRADCVRVVSARIQHSIEPFVPSARIAVLPIHEPTVALHSAGPVRGGVSFVFLVASRLTREKNVRLVIDAFADVVATRPEAKLIIAGEGAERADLERRASISVLREHVKFIGWQADLTDTFRLADCYVLSSNYEGYGRTVVRALAAGVPVIMTDVGVAGELVRHEETGLVVPVGDRSALTGAMVRMMHEAELRERVTRQAKEVVRTLPSEKEYLAQYKRLWETCSI